MKTCTDSVKWIGRCYTYAKELGKKQKNITQFPKEKLTKEENNTRFTLHDLDIVNVKL